MQERVDDRGAGEQDAPGIHILGQQSVAGAGGRSRLAMTVMSLQLASSGQGALIWPMRSGLHVVHEHAVVETGQGRDEGADGIALNQEVRGLGILR